MRLKAFVKDESIELVDQFRERPNQSESCVSTVMVMSAKDAPAVNKHLDDLYRIARARRMPECICKARGRKAAEGLVAMWIKEREKRGVPEGVTVKEIIAEAERWFDGMTVEGRRSTKFGAMPVEVSKWFMARIMDAEKIREEEEIRSITQKGGFARMNAERFESAEEAGAAFCEETKCEMPKGAGIEKEKWLEKLVSWMLEPRKISADIDS